MTKKTCPLGEDCALTVAWMAGRESAKDRIEALKAKLEKAVEALSWAEYHLGCVGSESAAVSETLAELKEDQ